MSITSRTILRIGLDLESQLPAHFQHHGILLENLSGYPFQAFRFGVLDDQLHQGPAQAPALEVGSQQNRVLTGLVGCVGVQSHDAKRLFGGFIDGDKCHRARIVEVDESGDELMREFFDRIEEAEP